MKLIDSIFRTSTNKLLQLALVQVLSYVGLLAATASDLASLSLMAIDFIHPAAIYRLTPLDLGPFGRPRSSFNSAVLMPFLLLACDISGDLVGICTFSKTYQQIDHAKRAVAYLSSTRA